MRWDARRDDNERPVIEAFKAIRVPGDEEEGGVCGISVEPLSAKGIPDLLVGITWKLEDGTVAQATELVEVKNPNGKARKPKLTSHQQVWHRRWKGKAAFVVQGPADVPAVVATITGRLRLVQGGKP